jgi:putative SOS response-associated peptidase YedK
MAWLDPHSDQGILDEILKPYPANEMTLYEVSTVVNSWKIDNLKCIQPL